MDIGHLMDILAPDLAQLNFVDLWLGHDYAEYNEISGAYAPIKPLATELDKDAERVRDHCRRTYAATSERGFTIDLKPGCLCRVTVMHDLRAEPVFILRKILSEIRPIAKIGLPRQMAELVLSADTRGLILVSGKQGAGKTNTAASIFSARLHQHGGRGLAVEDPPELKLDGRHGAGRGFQVGVSPKQGSYVDQIRTGMRTGTDLLFIGEIRDPDTAREAVLASINGMTTIATVHATDVIDAVRRVVTWAQSSHSGFANASELIGAGLSAVIHQRMERVETIGGVKARPLFNTLAVAGTERDGDAIRAKIKQGNLDSLAENIDQQNKRQQLS
ncbi:Flp pilus assembly complex ATPase component TadA [Xanthomonas campestris pv. campestris]|uniref:ATPase, T2SS/T4P/T4SS family n=1 Tax=Xanthomonas campestris TaxID=339 RepID=UPI001E35C264|nr:ATPase, T2SS/T4P/T4SS family [Xanthomonas campestris]MCD0253118.1 Flp pilus assembly complex ATPase component TadA [Xanthomonas campestris pv. campestris]